MNFFKKTFWFWIIVILNAFFMFECAFTLRCGLRTKHNVQLGDSDFIFYMSKYSLFILLGFAVIYYFYKSDDET